MIKRMGKFDWCAVIEKQWCNLWKRQNVLSLQACYKKAKILPLAIALIANLLIYAAGLIMF